MGSALWLAVLVLLLVPAAADDDDEQLLDQFKAAVRNRGELGKWTRGHGVCRFPGAACTRGTETLVSLSLAGIQLDVDFRDVASTLLRLGGVQAVSLRDANVTGSLASGSDGGWKCGQKVSALDLSGNSELRGSVGDARALSGACDGLRELNLSGNAFVGGKGDGGGRDISTSLYVLDLSHNNITGDGELGWLGGVRRLNLAGNSISGPLPVPAFANCSRIESLDLSGNEISGEVLPGVLSGCSALVSLDLSGNHLKGVFPPDTRWAPAPLIAFFILQLLQRLCAGLSRRACRAQDAGPQLQRAHRLYTVVTLPEHRLQARGALPAEQRPHRRHTADNLQL
jgi:protein brassinosteroid insensitive 1